MSRSLYGKLHRRFGARLTGAQRQQKVRQRINDIKQQIARAQPTDDQRKRFESTSVIVVGAGFAGLTSGYFLAKSGFPVTVLELSNRVGGRVHSLYDAEFCPGRITEAGAELIGLNHPLWLYFAEQFGLGLSVITPEDDFTGEMPLYLDGQLIPESEQEILYKQMTDVYDNVNSDAADVDGYSPWTAAKAQQWDQTTVADKLLEWRVSGLLRDAIEVDLANNQAAPTYVQSYLGLLAVVSGGGLQDYWAETEVFRCENGNQALAFSLQSVIESYPTGWIRLNSNVTSINIGSNGVIVSIQGSSPLTADYVIFAIPPNAWPKVTVIPSFPPGYQMYMGPAIKYLSNVASRFWIGQGLAPSGMSDLLGMTWEGTDNQMVTGSQGFELSVFAGGDAAQKAMNAGGSPAYFNPLIQTLYPGYTQNALQTQFSSHPALPGVWGGYSCPKPTQVTKIGPFLNQAYQQRMMFAGEHACLAFFGYMEGALQSGLRALFQTQTAEALLNPDKEK
jgi:monoamine oxidase